MKRTLFGKRLKQTFLAVPAAAMMLGASQAQTTVGLNFQAWYYDSGTTPQTIGFGAGYQTTGFPVTTNAFGVALADWTSTDPLDCQNPISTTVEFGGTLSAQLTANNAWQSGIGEQENGWVPQTVAPGNNEVTWGYLDDGGGGVTNFVPAASVSGLAAKFPHGYVIQTIAAEANVATFSGVDFTDGVTTNKAVYSTYYVANPVNDGTDLGGTVGLSTSSGTFTSDTININCELKTSGTRSTLAGFIITDKPVITKPAFNTTNYEGTSIILDAGAIGVSPLSYQWLHNGASLPGMTNVTYTNLSLSLADAGIYSVIVTNLYGSASNAVDIVNVLPLLLQIVPGNVVQDTKPVGSLFYGYNHSTTWSASSTDFNNVTRTGIEQFVATNRSQITLSAEPEFNGTNGTISFWMLFNLAGSFPGSGNEGAMLFDRRTINGAVIDLNVSGNIQFQAAGGQRFISTTFNGYVVDGNWHNVAITYGQSSNDVVSLYIDGVLDTSVINTNNWSWPTNQEIELGCSHDTYWYPYDGQMDDFRIYNRILTPTEIGVIGTPATSDTLVDTSALKVRFNFDASSTLFGNSIVWPSGTLQTSPTLGSGAMWAPFPSANSPQPVIFSGPGGFYRLLATP